MRMRINKGIIFILRIALGSNDMFTTEEYVSYDDGDRIKLDPECVQSGLRAVHVKWALKARIWSVMSRFSRFSDEGW